MRNIFDQYTQPENRLSHALAVCLDEDRTLLRAFLDWLEVKAPVAAANLKVAEQTLPGDVPETEAESDRKGLPDIVVHDGDDWCLLIESKVQAALTSDQLQRHERTLSRRGFGQIRRVALTKAGVKVPADTLAITWPGLYEWLGQEGRSGQWSARLRNYLRAAEVRLAQDGYLTEGTLTMFDGFPFSEDNPYTYGEAKRLLKLAVDEFRTNADLIAMGMDPHAKGRSAITGRGARVVWDFLSLSSRPKKGAFTGYPHLTFAIHHDHVEAAITIPNGVNPKVRKRFAELGSEGLIDLNGKILRRARRLTRLGACVFASVVQRHYPSQRASPVIDAKLSFKLETSVAKRSGPVKQQREWVNLFALIPNQVSSNLQFQYRVELPWGTKGLNTRSSLDLIVEGWKALEPLLDVLTGDD